MTDNLYKHLIQAAQSGPTVERHPKTGRFQKKAKPNPAPEPPPHPKPNNAKPNKTAKPIHNVDHTKLIKKLQEQGVHPKEIHAITGVHPKDHPKVEKPSEDNHAHSDFATHNLLRKHGFTGPNKKSPTDSSGRATYHSPEGFTKHKDVHKDLEKMGYIHSHKDEMKRSFKHPFKGKNFLSGNTKHHDVHHYTHPEHGDIVVHHRYKTNKAGKMVEHKSTIHHAGEKARNVVKTIGDHIAADYSRIA